MERKTRLKLKMIVSLCTCVLSLFSLISLTLAWFAMNDNTGAGGMDINVSGENIVSSCEYFVTESSVGDSFYSFVPADAEDKNKLGVYDVLNDRYQFLIKINLYSAKSVKVTADTNTGYFLGSVTAEDEGHWLTASGAGNVLSSVVSFSVFGRDELPQSGGGYILNALPENTSCFFDRTALGAATKPELSVTLADNLVVEADENGNSYFFVMVSYDPLLVSTVFSANIGNDVLEQAEDDIIPFELDFGIVVSAA